LRKLLNDPLFLRTPKGVVPTARALTLREPVAEILARVQNVLGSAAPFDPATTGRRFVVAAPDAVLASTTILLLERISAEAPHVDVGLIHVMPQRRAGSKEAPWAGCLMMLENREIDLAILPINQVPSRFEARRLYDEDFVVAMRKGHPFARLRPRLRSVPRSISWFRSTVILMASLTRCWQSAETGAVSS
jgi:DNA-binding transcriptional LysR family regulator